MDEKKHYSEIFEYGVLFSKFAIVTGLTAVALKNGDASFISKEPTSFLEECILVGASAAIPTALFAYNRRDPKKGLDKAGTINGILIAFMLFFIFHVLMELSGMNNSDTKDINPEDAEQQKTLSKYILNMTTYGCVVLLGSLMTYVAFVKVKDIGMFKQRALTSLFEFIFFGVANAIPYYKILTDRGMDKKESITKSVIMGGLFAGGYTMLQAGGFLTNLFGSGVEPR